MPRPKTYKEALCRELKNWASMLCSDVAQEGGERLNINDGHLEVEIRGETNDTITFSIRSKNQMPAYYEVKVAQKMS